MKLYIFAKNIEMIEQFDDIIFNGIKTYNKGLAYVYDTQKVYGVSSKIEANNTLFMVYYELMKEYPILQGIFYGNEPEDMYNEIGKNIKVLPNNPNIFMLDTIEKIYSVKAFIDSHKLPKNRICTKNLNISIL